jgi:hypothetical protein
MKKEPLPDWIDVNEAAVFVGKSASTIRRLLPDIEAAAPEHIRREPMEGRGGERVLLRRAYLEERFKVKAPEAAPIEEEEDSEPGGVAGVVAILEREIAAKNRQIEAMQRDGESKSRYLEEAQLQAGELTERLTQFAAINAGLQNKLLALTERAGEGSEPAARSGGESVMNSPWYFVLVAIVGALVVVLLLYLVLS